ncbi:MAG: hypothetical protein ACTHMJ_06305 [Thermomicrobiales bacterium]|jgi:hypothetical protein
MSLHEPHRPTPNNYVYQVLDQLQRATAPGRPSAAFVDLCDRASIPRDLRKQLLDQLVTGRYVTRHGGDVQITKTGEQLAAAAQGRLPERKPGR